MIIDIRDYSKYQEGHIKNAKHIPFLEVYFHPEKYLDRNIEYSFYCDSGFKSKRLVNYLNRLGYHCVNIEGGYANYLFK